MHAPRPIISRIDPPVEIISIELVKEFIGLDADIDAEQDKVLPVLIQAAIEQGQQITGIVWAQAPYRIDGLYTVWPGEGFLLPLVPVFAVTEVIGKDGSGVDIPVLADAYTVIPAAVDLGRPWAELHPVTSWPEAAVALSITCTAGWTAETLPESLRGWTLNRVATLYDYREDLVTGTITAAMPRHHINGLLDRWTVRESL